MSYGSSSWDDVASELNNNATRGPPKTGRNRVLVLWPSCGAGRRECCARLLCGALCSHPSRAGLLSRGRFRSRLAAKTERLRQLGTFRRIVRRDERMVALEVEGGAIFPRSHIVCARQVTLQRFEFLPAAQANN